ncbi:hypothetical protein ACQ86G_16115 [Roseateles chitinivorans]|uniref:hypothetical protein n=1 Tax=Roseateles chitinivorans TaxID=2917965 RepID=UPI003D668000
MTVGAQQREAPGGVQAMGLAVVGERADPVVGLEAVGGLEQFEVGREAGELGDRLAPGSRSVRGAWMGKVVVVVVRAARRRDSSESN